MLIPFTEPTSPRYIYVNRSSNRVHLMMPVVSGTDIGLDNTCKSVYALQEFFGKSGRPQQVTVLNELNHYKEALEFDLSLVMEIPELKQQKQVRLDQINHYIVLINTIQSNEVLNTLDSQSPAYPEPLQTLMRERHTNLYSMVLRPTAQDSYLRSVNPVFSVKRTNDRIGNPDSLLYQALHDVYQTMTIVPMDARSRLTAAVIASPAGQRIDFQGIQQALSQKAGKLLGVKADFIKIDKDYTHIDRDEDITQDFIDEEMGFNDNPASAEEYVDALINYCAPTLFETLPESPFYTIKTAEELSILTQFFLATVNIYCRAQQLSPANFGEVLDGCGELSKEVAGRVFSALSSSVNIEESLFDFVNEHQGDLQLKQALTPEDMAVIKKQFTEHYAEIKDSPHFDEFMVFDASKSGLFINHQGCICTDFCEFLAGIESTFFIQQNCKDFKAMNGHIEHKNEWIADRIELNIDVLTDEQLMTLLEKLPQEIRQEINQSSPERMARIARLQQIQTLPEFLLCVARGQQNEAERLLTTCPDAQQLLLTPSAFTDYSGRTFNCTAYEYAYWAKDAHMCRMLERHMDTATKADMSMRIETMERDGLSYQQQGQEHTSAHFDLTPLKIALQEYIDGYDNWDRTNNLAAMRTAWMKVGLAQRDVPAHVAQEYCRQDRSFSPLPSFNVAELALPRNLEFFNFETVDDESWYPLGHSSGLGFDFALIRAGGRLPCGEGDGVLWRGDSGPPGRRIDSAAVSRLDEVRDADLRQSREILLPADPEPGHGIRV